MTRINLVDPSHLTDKHLLAEYRELPRIFTAVGKKLKEDKQLPAITCSDKYCLGNGHVTFFYNKIPWLVIRFERLYGELIVRGFNIDRTMYNSILDHAYSLIGFNVCLFDYTWNPTPEDIYLNMARLVRRSKLESVKDELKNRD